MTNEKYVPGHHVHWVSAVADMILLYGYVGECFFLVPAHLGSPRQRAIKWLLLYCVMAMCCKQVDALHDKLTPVKPCWRHLQQSVCHGNKQKNQLIRVWDKIPEGSTLIVEGTVISLQHFVGYIEGSICVENSSVCSTVLTEHWLVTDRQTDTRQ